MDSPRKITLSNGPFTMESMVDGNVVKEFFRGCRIGLSWPCPDNTGGYYCIVAQSDKRVLIGKPSLNVRLTTGYYPLKVIDDFKGEGLSFLFDKLFNDMALYGCVEVCTDVSQKYESFIEALDEYHRKRRPKQEVRLIEAPFYSNFLQGVGLIEKWINMKAIEIPRESLIHSQLREIRKEDLYGKEYQRFFAINGLRYVLGEFEVKDVQGRTKGTVEKGISPRAWT